MQNPFVNHQQNELSIQKNQMVINHHKSEHVYVNNRLCRFLMRQLTGNIAARYSARP